MASAEPVYVDPSALRCLYVHEARSRAFCGWRERHRGGLRLTLFGRAEVAPGAGREAARLGPDGLLGHRPAEALTPGTERSDTALMRSVMLEIACGLALAAAGALTGCGSSSGGHPDTGYGALQAVPTSETCAAFCQRSIDCAVDLCDEDTNSTAAQQYQPLWLSECQVVCTDSLIQSSIPATAWTCLFTDSCRQVFGENSCHVPNASYKCQ